MQTSKLLNSLNATWTILSTKAAFVSLIFFYVYHACMIYFFQNITFDKIDGHKIDGYKKMFFYYELCENIHIALLICAGIIFLLWLYNIEKLVKKMGQERRYTDEWVIWAWFIPFLNFYAPYFVMKNICVSLGELTEEIVFSINLQKKLLVWWLFFILSEFLSLSVLPFQYFTTSIENQNIVFIINILLFFSQAISFTLVISLIKSIAKSVQSLQQVSKV